MQRKNSYYNIVFLLLILISLSACNEDMMDEDVVYLEPCEKNTGNVLYYQEKLKGIITLVELWVPERSNARLQQIRDGRIAMVRQRLHIIVSKESPPKRYWPCNVPRNLYSDERRSVEFSGYVLAPATAITKIEGLSPIYIDYIENDEDDDFAD
ncbi:MAG: hypothetical protein JJT94_01955 [Bernardetiaceae bacterium]|nr:hypothetical protein [Bernardetiaceae bacterium]